MDTLVTSPKLTKSPLREEPVTVLKSAGGTPGRLGGTTPTFVPEGTHQALVTALGAEEALKLGLKATQSRYRVRLPAGVAVVPGDRLHFRNRDWAVEFAEGRVNFTKVIASEVR